MLQSHTATQQWQSFEMRMRQRRVERCLLRASAAIEAGVLDDAREALEEVRRLTPDEPALEPLVARLAKAAHPPPIPAMVPAPVENRPARHHRLAAAAVMLTGSIVAGWWWSSSVPAVSVAKQVTATPALPTPSVRVDETSVTAPVSEETVPAVEAPADTSESALADNSSAGAGLSRAGVEGRDDRPNAGAGAATPPESRETVPDSRGNAASEPPGGAQPQPADTRELRLTFAAPGNAAIRPSLNDVSPVVVPPDAATKLEPLRGLPETADPSPPVVTGTEGITAPDATPRAAATLPAVPSAPPPSPAPIARADEQSVRAALSRYESAYNQLDAAAAASVWPGVNQRALASAFQGLSAQSISLGRCDVRVSGATAHAECSGNARWTPKVGGGRQGGARQWRFDLRNSGGDWVITQATAR